MQPSDQQADNSTHSATVNAGKTMDVSMAALLFPGASEMARRMRQFDWAATPLGPAEHWPQALKTVVRILLTSRQPMWIGWGPELIYLYNDPYFSIIGGKHPGALGQPTTVVWREIWDDIGPLLESALGEAGGIYVEEQLLIMQRNGFPEETYYTFSYSPIANDDGSIGGILCVNTDDTERVISERRLTLLRELAARTADARTSRNVLQRAIDALGTNPRDLPFALVYMAEGDGRGVLRIGQCGIEQGHVAAPDFIPLDGPSRWPIAEVLTSKDAMPVLDLHRLFGDEAPRGVWHYAPTHALALPISPASEGGRRGVLIVGLNPLRPFDAKYQSFLSLAAGQIAANVANADAYEQEKRRAEALAEIDQAKTRFFTKISHEFRTPLTLMLGPLEDMLAKPAGGVIQDNRQLMEVVHRHSLRLLKLVNTLLDFSRIEAGRMRALYAPVDLAALTCDLASQFRASIDKAGLRLVIACEPLEEFVFVDRDMWEKIVLNLMSNAFKFTFEGEIEVRLRRIGAAVELSVRDTGVGIPADDLPHVFERFHRVEGAKRRSHEGTGIGLALVRELAWLHGGTARVESVEGQGTTFTVIVPLGSAHLPPEQVSATGAANPTLLPTTVFAEEALRWLPDDLLDEESPLVAPAEPHPMDVALPDTPPRRCPGDTLAGRPRILIADDNADMREYLRRLLAERFDVEAAADGAAALHAARRRRPDLVLTDVMMPEMDGFELLARLRDDRSLRDLPVIMLSARAGEEARIEGTQAGADDYLVKPFSSRELLARVTTHLQLAGVRQDAAEAVRRGEERLRAALANSDTGTFRWNPETGEYLEFDDNLKRLFGLDAQRRVRWLDDLIDRIHPDDIPDLLAAIERRRDGAEFEMEFRVVLPDGSIRWLYDRAGLQFGSEASSTHVVGACTDITRQKLAEQGSAHFVAIVEWSDDAIVSKNLDGIITSWNRGAERIFGYRAEEVIGRSITLLIPEDHLAEEPRILERIRRGEAIDHYETIRRRKDGRLIDVSLTVSPLFDAQGRIFGASKIARDVTERKRLEDSLRDSERRLRTLTEAVPNLLWSDGPDGQCDWLSSQWTTYTGVPVEELLGLRWLDRVIHPDDRQRTLACWRTACADRGDYDLEYRIRRHDGEYHWFKTRGVPLRDKQGTIIQWFGTCTDIEESKRLEAELREADRRKDEFLATLAHELRNPLAPLRQGLELLRAKGGLGTDSEAIQRMMERQVDHMVRLVDDLMEVSRITRGKIELRTELLDLRAVIRGAIETSQPLIDAAGHVLSVHLPDRPLYVRGDALRLSQVLTNLLNNAAKYTPRGGRIWLSARSGGAEAVVSVRDNGLGIPPEMLPNVFQMFTQIDRNLQRAQGGLGIGLALVKSLAQMHGGGVQVASEGAGQGSQFTLHLPLAEPSQSARAGLSANGHRTAARPRRRVLVVDDNRDGADSLGMLLRVSGEEVRVAYDGPSALETAVTFRPEIALLDIGMPGMSGYELAGALRERDDSKRLVLIAMTGWGQEDDRRRTREAGFCAHLVKPVDFPKLQALLDELPAAV